MPGIQQQIIDGLVRALKGDRSATDVDRIETHISTLLLAGDRAYKIKKPVDFGFLDFSTLDKRRHFCEEELRLNRRLVSDLYLRVVPITGSPEQPCLDGEGEAIEWVVEMRRFSDAGLLSHRTEPLSDALVLRLADDIASFHQAVDVAGSEDGFGSPPQILAPMVENFHQINQLIDDGDIRYSIGQLEAWTHEAHRRLSPLLKQRLQQGFIRECHGDLHLGNITLEGERITIFDGIEFNASLRWIDIESELAFLLMDLECRGQIRAARLLLDRYQQRLGDYEGLRLSRFYKVYRAMVRAKVATIGYVQAKETGVPVEVIRERLQEVHTYLDLAKTYMSPEIPPVLVITHGLSGSGKSWSTDQLLVDIPLVRLRSDVERKRLAKLALEQPSGSRVDGGLYTDDYSELTYRRLFELARMLLKASVGVIVDATFLSRSRRQAFQRLAENFGAPFLILDFRVEHDLLQRRIIQRKQQADNASEAGIEVLEKQIGVDEPLEETEKPLALVLGPEGFGRDELSFMLQWIDDQLGKRGE
ncbi:MAG: AAA family ATPase [Gammaproteobacteria bacterium]|nr:AAA family ATPase [Gammaproteobacteria bacterium]